MSILVDKNTRLVVQGITGREGEFHTRQMLEYGTNVVAGVTPGKGGGWVAGVPVFDTVQRGRATPPRPTPPSSMSRPALRPTPSWKRPMQASSSSSASPRASRFWT